MPFSGYLSNPGIELGSPALQADSLPTEPPGKPSFVWTVCGSNVTLAYKASASLVRDSEDRTVPHRPLSAAWAVPPSELCSQVPPGSGASFSLQGGKARIPPTGSMSKGHRRHRAGGP